MSRTVRRPHGPSGGAHTNPEPHANRESHPNPGSRPNPESRIPNPVPRFIFFAGKGGVGKTTCAAARAILEAARGARVLAVSTDPAHSLGDALGVRLSAAPRPVLRHLHAVELDAPRAFARWVAAHRHALADIVEHGTWLDRHDADALLDLPIPGVDELVGLVEIVRMASASYDTVIVDTAPTGHTLRLLGAPETVASVAGLLDALQHEHRLIRERFAQRRSPEAADRLIALIAAEAQETGARLRDGARTAFEWVMLPEALSLAESGDGVRALERARIAVPDLIINRVMPRGPACPVCDRRRAEEQRIVERTIRTLGRGRRTFTIAAQTREPRGRKALAALARASVPARRPAAMAVRYRAPNAVSALPERDAVALHESRVFAPASLLFFGGKGGVGKTTVAAAAAVRLARADPARRVLLLSTDPAHSLADVLGARVGDRPAAIGGGPPNLHVRELDAAAAFAARRADLEAALVQVMGTLDGDASADSARRSAAHLMDLAPPGIDELFGMLTVVESQRDYPLIVVDTAPTGHALRLLEMPDAARDWVQVLLRVLLKYRSIVRPGHLAAELVDLSKSIRELRDRVRDRAATRFIVVTRAAGVPRRETERLLVRLRRLHLAVPAIVTNARTLAPGRCARCRATMAAELKEQKALRRFRTRNLRACAIIQTPLAAPPPCGVAALDRWARTWSIDASRERKRGAPHRPRARRDGKS